MAQQMSKIHKRLNTPVELREPLGPEQKPNSFWTELDNVYSKLLGASQAIGQHILSSVQNITSDPILSSYIKDAKEFANTLNLISRDISEHQQRLKAIYDTHIGKLGGTVDADEHMLVLNLHSQYQEELQLFTSSIDPSIIIIKEQIEYVEKTNLDMKNKQNNNDLLDPNVVSDVEFKTK